MTVFKNRYQATKAKEKSSDVVVKVCGGYIVMDARQYQEWRKQK